MSIDAWVWVNRGWQKTKIEKEKSQGMITNKNTNGSKYKAYLQKQHKV